MSDDLKAQLEAQKARSTGQPAKKASEVFRGHKDVMANMAVYLPKSTIRQLKNLAFAEGTSASKIVEELLAPRLLEGPRNESQQPPQSSSRRIE